MTRITSLLPFDYLIAYDRERLKQTFESFGLQEVNIWCLDGRPPYHNKKRTFVQYVVDDATENKLQTRFPHDKFARELKKYILKDFQPTTREWIQEKRPSLHRILAKMSMWQLDHVAFTENSILDMFNPPSLRVERNLSEIKTNLATLETMGLVSQYKKGQSWNDYLLGMWILTSDGKKLYPLY